MFSSFSGRSKPTSVVRLRHRFGAQALEFYQEGAMELHSPWWRQAGLKWDDSDLQRIRLLRQLEDDELLSGAAELLYLPYEHWHKLEGADQVGLAVAKPFSLCTKLVALGDAGSEKFELRLECRDSENVKLELEDRAGPFVRYDHTRYFLNASQLLLFEALEQANPVLKNREIQPRLVVLGRVLAAAEAAGIGVDPYLSAQRILSPQTIQPTVRISQEDDTLEIVPAFDGHQAEAKLQNQLDQDQPVKPIYQYNREDGTSSRVVLSEPLQEAVTQIRKVRKLKGKERRRFLDSPEDFLAHPAIDLSDFGDRVIGLVAQRVRFYPQIPKSETEWLPTVALKIEDECGLSDPWEMVVDVADVTEMLEQLHTAQQDNISTFEFKGLDFPANAVIERKLEDLHKRLQPPKQDDREGVGERAPRLELDIKENIDSVEYEEVSASAQEIQLPWERPASLKQQISLLPHQEDGVAWLQSLCRQQGSHGALLADDMGLGKTIQLWTFLEWVRLGRSERRPSLIVCPVSLIHNWEDEYTKFFAGEHSVPHYALAKLQGENIRSFLRGKEIDRERLGQHPYVITSYETLRQYHLDFARIDWACVVLDEAQKIKNPAAQVTRSAKALKADFRIASTGTPVENHLSDLWCIVDFIEPGRLGCLKDFLKEFPNDPTQADDLTSRIQERCGLLFKRRLKSQISQGLPAKTPLSPRISMSKKQAQQYLSTVALAQKKEGESVPILSVLQSLRRLCAFQQGSELCPDLASLRQDAAKFSWLLDTLDKIRVKQEKALVFVELREFQRLLAQWLGEKYRLDVRTINGEVSTAREKDGSRHKILQEFNDRPGFQILILSPLAAGVGLTITCANHVIHFMRHWNPAKEDQATDRAYRIGQTREVFVYYPLCIHPDMKSFDEGLHDLLERKRELAARALFPSLYGEVRPDEVWGTMVGTRSG